MEIKVFKTRREMGDAAGKAVEAKILDLLQRQDELRMVFAAAPSQNDVLNYLCHSKNIPWSKIVAFHMDEYVGLPAGAPQLFSSYLKTQLFEQVNLKETHFINGNGGEEEMQRYTRLLGDKPIDIVCLGIGENGHIAFNDPPVADFNDPRTVKEVKLDHACRQQQVNDGCFPRIEDVPSHAITLTIPALMAGKHLYCVVPGKTKRAAVAATLAGPLSTDCPATILRKHPHCTLYLDEESSGDNVKPGAA